MRDELTVVAVIDDDPDACLGLKRLLSSIGYTVEAFSSGAAFMRAIGEHKPDCAVLDLHMPEVSGFDVLEQLATRPAGPPAVAITGHDSPETRSRALELGAVAYLCKPIDEDELVAAINTAIGRSA